MPVKDTDRAEFETFHDLGFDGDGREVLVGLSYEETEWYLDILERDRSGRGCITKEEQLRRSYLDDRHATVRLQIAQAVDDARFDAVRGGKTRPRHASDGLKIHPGAVAMTSKFRTNTESI
jgi:hypothetical protein